MEVHGGPATVRNAGVAAKEGRSARLFSNVPTWLQHDPEMTWAGQGRWGDALHLTDVTKCMAGYELS